jgi:hypothetical protein
MAKKPVRKKTKPVVTQAPIAVKPLTRFETKFPDPANVKEGFLIGNGESRRGFNLESLKNRGNPVFGCNALYRDFEPDVLCALDHGVLLELMNAGYEGIIGKLNKTHSQVILDNLYLEKLKVPREKRVAWYTGIFAAWLMCQSFPKLNRVFMLGFDLHNAKTNNVYKGSLNYEKMGMNNKIQFENFCNLVFKNFPDTTFLRVVEDDSESPLPDEWILVENVRNISYEDFNGYL